VRRLVVLVSAIVLVDTAFYATVAPLLPHYADELDLSKAAAGVLAGSYAAGMLIGALPGGWLAGRVGVKPTVLLGLTFMSVSSLAFGFAHHIVLLDAARFVQGVGGACSWAGAMAWLIEDAPSERRGELIGTALGAAIGGALLGPVVGTLADAVGTEAVFSSVVGLGALLAAWVWRTPVAHPRAGATGSVLSAVRHPAVAAGMWLVALPALCFGSVAVLVPLRMDHLGAGSVAVGAMFLVAAGFEAIVSPLIGRLSDRRGRLVPLRLGLALSAPLIVSLSLPSRAIVLVVLVVAVASALGTFWAPAMALLSDAADGAGLTQGMAFALTNLAWAVGQTTGSAAGGTLADATADAVPYALLCAVSVLTLGALVRGRQARHSPFIRRSKALGRSA
jgi:MFS family permease